MSDPGKSADPKEPNAKEPNAKEPNAKEPNGKEPTGTQAGATPSGQGSAAKPRRARASAGMGAKVKAGSDALRSRLATVVWLAAVLCALFLAVGALLIALKANEDNPAVQFVISGGELLDGPFGLTDGIFTFADGQDGRVRSALVNWGLAAVVYLVIGKILDRVIRP